MAWRGIGKDLCLDVSGGKGELDDELGRNGAEIVEAAGLGGDRRAAGVSETSLK